MATANGTPSVPRPTSALEQFRELLARYPQYRAWPDFQPLTQPTPAAPPAADEVRAAWETLLADEPAALDMVREAERAARAATCAGDKVCHSVALAILDERTRPTMRHS